MICIFIKKHCFVKTKTLLSAEGTSSIPARLHLPDLIFYGIRRYHTFPIKIQCFFVIGTKISRLSKVMQVKLCYILLQSLLYMCKVLHNFFYMALNTYHSYRLTYQTVNISNSLSCPRGTHIAKLAVTMRL